MNIFGSIIIFAEIFIQVKEENEVGDLQSEYRKSSRNIEEKREQKGAKRLKTQWEQKGTAARSKVPATDDTTENTRVGHEKQSWEENQWKK